MSHATELNKFLFAENQRRPLDEGRLLRELQQLAEFVQKMAIALDTAESTITSQAATIADHEARITALEP